VCVSVTARCCGVSVLASLLAGVAAPLPAQTAPAAPEWALVAGGTLDLRWLTPVGDVVGAPPAFDTDAAYVPMKRGAIVAFDVDSGAVRWSAAGVTPHAPAVGDGRIYLAMDGGVRALDAGSGRVLWQRPLPAAAASPPYWDTGWLVISIEGGDLVALRAADGEILWRSALGSVAQTAPAPALDVLYLGLADGRLVAVRLATGAPVWTRQLAGTATGLLALDDQLVVGTTAREAHSLDLRTGRTRWRWRLGGVAVGAAAADADHIYLVAYDHLVRAVDRGSGNLRWRRALPHRPAGSPVLVGPIVLVPSLSTELSAYDATTGEPVLAIRSTGEVAGETHVRRGGSAVGTRLLAVSVEGRLLAFAPRVEPPITPLEALPGTPVVEPPAAAAQPAAATPPPRRERR
jgi:outer membrane protein assembly factor BamB